MSQWLIATVVFIAVGLVGFVFGHMWSLGLLIAILIGVAVLGGRPEGLDQIDRADPGHEPVPTDDRDGQGT